MHIEYRSGPVLYIRMLESYARHLRSKITTVHCVYHRWLWILEALVDLLRSNPTELDTSGLVAMVKILLPHFILAPQYQWALSDYHVGQQQSPYDPTRSQTIILCFLVHGPMR